MAEERSPDDPQTGAGWAATAVASELVRPLRAEVLRPGWPAAASRYSGDDDPLAVHGAVRSDDGMLRSVGSLLPEEPASWVAAWPGMPPLVAGGRWWRVRGMATEPAWRWRGLGRSVLELLLERAAAAGGGTVWCNARVPALGFYRRAGFRSVGEVFEAPGIGPHVVMWRRLPGGAR